MGGLREESGDAVDDREFAGLSSSSTTTNPDPSSISHETWAMAEETTKEVLCSISPTLYSEERRKDVTEYVQRLIKSAIGCEVFPYGSVPLKTYLPDGDIDLTALTTPDVEESLARDVLLVLQGEEHNEDADYRVKDARFIDAELDRLSGKDHLFKRSIILMKAWCYYESHILGAHHGLISTYALEILVLYIFHHFNSTLTGPLMVLYRFLDYFSRFDWDNYCVSLDGPVQKSSLPDIVVKRPESGGNDLMLSEEFLRNSIVMFSVASRVLDSNLRAFPQKHLNIVDPLKESNNLGRSVYKGNFFRIRSAFRFGARELGRILLLPRERVADGIKSFFINALNRHGVSHCVPDDAQGSSVETLQFGNLSLSFPTVTLPENKAYSNISNVESDDDTAGVESIHFCGTKKDSLENVNLCNKTLSDLGGDYDSHIRSLLYGQPRHSFALAGSSVPSDSPSVSSELRSQKPWETVRRRMPLIRNSHSQVNTNGDVVGHPFGFGSNLDRHSGAAFGWKARHKAHGTGTDIPTTGGFSNRGRHASGRGRNRPPSSWEHPHRYAGGNPHHGGNSLAGGFSSSQEMIEFGSLGPLLVHAPDVIYGAKKERAE